MPMERMGRQRLTRDRSTQAGPRVGKFETPPKFDFKLELQTNSWFRISLSAKDLEKKFSNLFCHFTAVNLREAFRALDGTKAVGMDGKTKHGYMRNLVTTSLRKQATALKPLLDRKIYAF